MQSAITHVFAGVAVSDLDASIDWYTRFLGRLPDMRAGEEILWEVDEHATFFIEPNAARPHIAYESLSTSVGGRPPLGEVEDRRRPEQYDDEEWRNS
jgi:catechol 2,3-dioxygenase-like lactoylglutathione lyase family enzyme